MALGPVSGNSGTSSSMMTLDSRSQILMLFVVAAHSQYLFGEKTRAWISDPALRL